MTPVRLDFRPGDLFHYGMSAPGGGLLWGRFAYREIRSPGLIVFVISFSDEKGGLTRSPFHSHWPLQVMYRLTLDAYDDWTRITLTGHPLEAADDEHRVFVDGFDSLRKDVQGALDRLGDYLARETGMPVSGRTRPASRPMAPRRF